MISEKHETHFYVDEKGVYIGGFGDGAKPTDPNAIRVLVAPDRGDDVWNGSSWDAAVKSQTDIDAEIDKETDAENSKGARADRLMLFRVLKAADPDYTNADFRRDRRALIEKMS